MRLAMVLSLSAVVLGVGVSATKLAPAPFEGSWLRCDTNGGSRVCGFAQTTQRGKRVCGITGSLASGRFYHTRFVGNADGNAMRIDKICGRPGSDTFTHCVDQAPRHLNRGEKVGWETSGDMFYVCKGRLHSRSGDEAFDCATAVREAGKPKVRRLPKSDSPDEIERAWLASCTAGRE